MNSASQSACPAEGRYGGGNVYAFSEKPYGSGPVDKSASQSTCRLIADEKHGGLGSPEVMLKMVADAAGFTHAAGRDDDLRGIIRIYGFRVVTRDRKGKSVEYHGIDPAVDKGKRLLIEVFPEVVVVDVGGFDGKGAVNIYGE